MMLAQSIAVVVVLLLLASAGNATPTVTIGTATSWKGAPTHRIESTLTDPATAIGQRPQVSSDTFVGVTDTLNGTRLCPGMKVPVGQLIGVVTKYLQGVPEEWNLPASTIVLRALEPVFPCKK